MYHNTTNLSGAELKKAQKRALTQNEAIYLLFTQRSRDFIPSEVLFILEEKLNYPPLTSIRRSISNLTRFGLLIKTEIKRNGQYGRKEYAWRRAIEPKPETEPDLDFDYEAFEKSILEPSEC